MKNLNVLLVFIFLFISHIGVSQINPELITRANGMYFYQDKTYHKERDLKEIYKTNPKAYRAYKDYILTRRTHRVLTLACGVALIRWSKWKDDKIAARPAMCNGCHPDLSIIPITVLVFAGSAAIIFSTGMAVYKRRGKALVVFNESVLSSSKVGAIPPNLNFQTSQNGIGLVFNF